STEEGGHGVTDGAGWRVVRHAHVHAGTPVGVAPEIHDPGVANGGARHALPGDAFVIPPVGEGRVPFHVQPCRTPRHPARGRIPGPADGVEVVHGARKVLNVAQVPEYLLDRGVDVDGLPDIDRAPPGPGTDEPAGGKVRHGARGGAEA